MHNMLVVFLLLSISFITSCKTINSSSQGLNNQKISIQNPSQKQILDQKRIMQPSEFIEYILDRYSKSKSNTIDNNAFAKCVVFDADGTLWRKDLAESVVVEVKEKKLFSKDSLLPLNDILKLYEEPIATNTIEALDYLKSAYDSGRMDDYALKKGWIPEKANYDIWPSYNFLFIGWPEKNLSDHTQRIMDKNFAGEIYQGLRSILSTLRSQGFKTVVVSSCMETSVKSAATYLGFLPEEVRGMRSKIVAGKITKDLELPIMYGEGKMIAARELCKGRPWAAFGDSVATSDKVMLSDAFTPVAVEPYGKHLLRANEQRYSILNFIQTESGDKADRFSP